MPATQDLAAHRRRDARLRALAFALLAALLLGALVVSFAVTPEQIESGQVVLSPTCMTKRLLGVPCLTCGMTRAFAALSHGRLADALEYNRLVPFAYLVCWAGGVGALVACGRAVRELNAATPRPDPSSTARVSRSRGRP